MKQLVSIVLMGTLLGSLVYAQESSKPALSDTQKLKIEVLNLQAQVQQKDFDVVKLKVELGQALAIAAPAIERNMSEQFKARLDALAAEINAANPDFTWDASSGNFSPKPKPEQKD